jgi:hypothetical protein
METITIDPADREEREEMKREEDARMELEKAQIRRYSSYALLLILAIVFFFLILLNPFWIEARQSLQKSAVQSWQQVKERFSEEHKSEAVSSGVLSPDSASAVASADSLQRADGQIKAGALPDEQSSAETPAEKAAAQKEAIARKIVVRGADGWLSIKHLNVDPYSRFRTPAKDRKVLAGQGYTAAEIEEYFTLLEQGKCSQESFARGTEYLWMSHGNARVLDKLRATWDKPESATVCQLQGGRTVVIMEACENLAEVPPRAPAPQPIPEIREEIIPPPAPAIAPAPPPTEEIVIPPPVVPVPATEAPPVEEASKCFPDGKMVLGQEHEPRHHGNKTDSSYLSAAAYLCAWRSADDTGTHSIGIGTQDSWWSGTVNGGLGGFKGKVLTIGPGYQYVADKGWVIEAKGLVGKLRESFSQGEYQSDRQFNVFGVAVAYSNYERWMRGETWFQEFQLFGSVLFPLTEKFSHSWQGSPIADTKGLSEFNTLVGLGGRLWINDNPIIHPYFQTGLFWENPGAQSASFRLGIADPNHICGIGVGLDYDLIRGGSAKAWGWWCDPVRGIKVYREAHRAEQIVAEIGGGASLRNGIIMIPVTDGVNGKPVESVNTGAINSELLPLTEAAQSVELVSHTETVFTEKDSIGSIASVGVDENPEEAPAEADKGGVTSVETIDTELPNLSADSTPSDHPSNEGVTVEPLPLLE